MSKFVLVENSSDGECGEPFEAVSWEEAATEVLEQMGYRLKEIQDKEIERTMEE